MLMTAALFTSWSASLTVVPLFAASAWGATPSQLGALYSVAAISGVLGAPCGGYLADRVRARADPHPHLTTALAFIHDAALSVAARTLSPPDAADALHM